MKNLNNDIINSSTEEAEETYAPEAKQVEALPFHGRGTGSSPVRSTRDADDWRVDPCGNDFSVIKKTAIIGGNAFSRLSLE
jgi:hypothetical protein